MRAALALWLVALTAAGGCAAGASSVANAADSPTPTVDVRANGRAACLAVRKASDEYGNDILALSGAQLQLKTREWSDQIGRAARGADDMTLRSTLLSLADVVRAWADRPPDNTSVRGFRNDLDVACRPYLAAAPSSAP